MLVRNWKGLALPLDNPNRFVLISMVMITRVSGSGSRLEGSGPSGEDIHDWIKTTVAADVREMIPEMFGTIKTELITLFDERYVVVASTTTFTAIDVVATTSIRDKDMPY